MSELCGAVILSLAFTTGCAFDTEEACEGAACDAMLQKDQDLFAKSTGIWRTSSVPVCWENPTASDATARGWIQNSILNTWQGVTRLKFTGWGQCVAGAKGLRIRIEDVAKAPHTLGMGRALDGLANGMSLNPRFLNWSPTCPVRYSLEACVRAVAVHEFGHAIGFAHEQNRPDRPSCTKSNQGEMGNILVGPYDANSIMNYCNVNWNNVGRLSDSDIKYSRYFYGNPTETVAQRGAVDWGNGKLYFFNKTNYLRYDIANDRMDDLYPKAILGNWTGFPTTWSGSIDEAVNWDNTSAYFFKGAQYVKVSVSSRTVTTGPSALSSLISGWPPTWTTVDAVVNVPAGSPGNYWDKKIYFFRGTEYLRVNATTRTVDQAPKLITAGWPGVWSSGIDYAFTKGNKVYFFKGTQYERYNLSNTSALDKLDAGYPLGIMGYWPGVPF